MAQYFVDLHIHLGRTSTNRPVKITAAKSLTLENIIPFARDVKGIDMIGIIDCHVPEIIAQLKQWIAARKAMEHEDGGILFPNGLTLLLGTELEIYDENCHGPIHVLAYFPFLEQMERFSQWLNKRVKNMTLSTQRIYENGRIIQQKVKELDGLFIPAHIFTPFKSLYGKGVISSLEEVFVPSFIDAVELGLSSDTEMAQLVDELSNYTFLTNSDSHSLEKIAREYQVLELKEPTFLELTKALRNEGERKIVKNYGLDPRLGKYYFTSCEKCQQPMINPTNEKCPNCGHKSFVKGVLQRIEELKAKSNVEQRRKRPPYIHQVPLQFIPKLGPKTLQKLRQRFGTDMDIIHHTTRDELLEVVHESIVEKILQARTGTISIKMGGAGRYGKID